MSEPTLVAGFFVTPKEAYRGEETDQGPSGCAEEGQKEVAVPVLDELRETELEELEQYRKGLTPAPMLYRSLTTKVDQQATDVVQFVASEESEDRLGDVIKVDGWQLENFRKNPVFLYVHDQTFPPLGSVPKVGVEGKQLLATVKFDMADEFAALIAGKYERGVMRAVSVGFKALAYEERLASSEGKKTSGMLFTKQELVELSAVPIPAHPKALKRALGTRSQFWIPFTMEQESKVATLREQLEAIKADAMALLAKLVLPEEPPASKPDNDLADILTELQRVAP